MAQTIKLKRSSVSGNTPSTSDLELGEVAINTYDGKMDEDDKPDVLEDDSTYKEEELIEEECESCTI